jgi:OOP family OmpA-OmpF porin
VKRKFLLLSLVTAILWGEEPATSVLDMVGNIQIVGWGNSTPQRYKYHPVNLPQTARCRDADGDGVPDYLDRCPNTPSGLAVDYKGCPVLFTFPLRLLFDFNKAKIKKIYYPQLKKVAKVLKNNPYMKIEIAGYTDNAGSRKYNLKLSYNRALAVKQALVGYYHINPQRIVVRGYGESHPLVPNTTPTNRALNRRVDIVDITRELPKSALPKPTPAQLQYCKVKPQTPAVVGEKSSSKPVSSIKRTIERKTPVLPAPKRKPYKEAFVPLKPMNLEEEKITPITPETFHPKKRVKIAPSSPMKNGPTPKIRVEYLN